jgi:hypothetical protein
MQILVEFVIYFGMFGGGMAVILLVAYTLKHFLTKIKKYSKNTTK